MVKQNSFSSVPGPFSQSDNESANFLNSAIDTQEERGFYDKIQRTTTKNLTRTLSGSNKSMEERRDSSLSGDSDELKH